MQLAAESIIEVGRELIEQKRQLGHGNFLPWIAAEFGMSDQTARNMMRVATEFGDKIKTVLDLPPTALYALATPSTQPEVRKDFTPSERVAIARAVENALGERRGGDRKSEGTIVPLDASAGERTRDIAAAKSGFTSGKQYERAKTGHDLIRQNIGRGTPNGHSIHWNVGRGEENEFKFNPLERWYKWEESNLTIN